MERKRKFTSTCAEIKSELKAMDPLNVGIYEDDQESISMSLTMSSTLRTLSGMVVCPSSCLFGPLFFLGS